MKRATLKKEIARIIEEGAIGGHDNVLRNKELKKGYRLANPETDKWLNDDEWENHVISVNGKKVRIIILMVKTQYQGAFSRLINNILKAGLRPIVIAPLMDMPLILTWWGWKKHLSGTTFEDREDYWIPTKQWVNKRLINNIEE